MKPLLWAAKSSAAAFKMTATGTVIYRATDCTSPFERLMEVWSNGSSRARGYFWGWSVKLHQVVSWRGVNKSCIRHVGQRGPADMGAARMGAADMTSTRTLEFCMVI